MSAITIQQMADRVAGLLEERLRLRGAGLAAKLKSGGRRLPRRVREAAGRLAKAAEMAENPKLLLQVDEGQVAADYDVCLKHLGGLTRPDRARVIVADVAVRIALSLLIVACLGFAFAYWRGLL